MLVTVRFNVQLFLRQIELFIFIAYVIPHDSVVKVIT